MNLSELFMKIAKEMKNDHFFGIPGSGVPLDLMDSGKNIDLHFINVAHESTAAIAAGTYGLIKESAGLCLGVKGVGAGNLAGGVANAYFERMPVVCVCETTPNYSYENEMVQHTDHQGLMKSVTKSMITLSSDNPAHSIRNAFSTSIDGLPGPVLIDFPSDMGLIEAEDEKLRPKDKGHNNSFDKIKEIINLINNSKKPMILIGDGARKDDAIEEVVKLSEKIGAGVLSTMKARGVFPETHKRWVGVSTAFGQGDNSRPNILTSGSDLIILIGADQMMTHAPWPEGVVDTVEIVSNRKSKTLSSSPKTICSGNIKDLIKMLMDSNEKTGWKTDEIHQIYKDIDPRFSRPKSAIFAAQDVIEISKEILPKDGLLFTETGAFIALLENTWKFDKPLKYFGTSGGRSMGLMIPSYIGGALATNNETPLMGIGADGSTLMRLGEFETIKRSNLKWPIVIINDAALGTMKYRQGFRGYDDYGLDLKMVDFAGVAKSCGLKGETADNPEDFRKALINAFKSEVATVIDARIDPKIYQDNFGGTIGD
jgi:acetolactate synthase-1/2/3 large subunit